MLVVGGRGFVGAAVVRALAATGLRPVLFGPPMEEDRLADLAGRFDEIAGSIEDRTALAAAFAAARPGAVVSCAAHGAGRLGLMRSGETEADAAIAVNVVGFAKLLDAAREAGVARVVWTSSTVVYGPASTYPERLVDEDDPPAPTTVYGLTKALAEEVARYHVRRHRLAVIGLRLPLVLGPGLWYQGAASALMDLFDAARRGEPARVVFHDEPFDLMHVDDAAQAILAAVRHPGLLAPAYNLHGFRARASDLLGEIDRRRPDARLALDPVPPALLFPLVDGARFRTATGFSARYDLPRFVRAMLEETR